MNLQLNCKNKKKLKKCFLGFIKINGIQVSILYSRNHLFGGKSIVEKEMCNNVKYVNDFPTDSFIFCIFMAWKMNISVNWEVQIIPIAVIHMIAI